jgi:CrcB protein
MIKTIFAISAGASIGAVLRWFLGLKLNHIFPSLPIGTLTANLLGCYLIGFFVAFFAQNASLSPEWRLFIITGFLGGLTTFSTFSAEMTTLIQQAKFETLALGLLAHVGGSLLMTALGIFSFAVISNLLK